MKQNCIILRNGSEIWIPEEKAKHLAQALAEETAPRFVKLTDAGNRLINTADIVEFCTKEQMDDRIRLKNGEWKCDHGRWHSRREKCNCSQIEADSRRQLEEQARQNEMNRTRTPEEQKRINKKLADMRKDLSERLGWKFKKKT